MSPALQVANARRTTARIILITIVSLMTVLVLFSSSNPLGAISFAQQTSPGVSIKFVNPDSDTSNEISSVNDGTDTAVHLVAWVNQNPTSPVVEFQYQATPTGPFNTIGQAAQVGNDTWELKWDATHQHFPADNSSGTLKVNLYSGTGTAALASDTEAVTVNNTGPSTSGPADHNVPNAVEITYPVNGGIMGFYPTATEYQGQVNVTASTNTDTVHVYYTITPPGSDPQWKECGSESRSEAVDDGVTCSLLDDDDPDQVRGIAAVAEDDDEFNPPTFVDKDSADGHRATGYVQSPGSVTIAPATQNVSTPQGAAANTYNCSGPITAQVFDQNARPIKGINVDVHAQGPSDGTQFDDAGGGENPSSPNKAPDRGNHQTEPVADCESLLTPPANATSGTQGDHELGGEFDIKHIESGSDGTDEEGKFTFRLLGRTTGTTQFTVWVDRDDNDLFCAQEPNVNGSIGWGVSAPTPAGITADEQTCASPAPPSPTRTATPTNTTTPPPTNTTTPPPTTPPPDEPETFTFNTRVTIDYDRSPSDFEGDVKSGHGDCVGQRDVVLKKVRKGRPDKVVGRDTTNSRGEYRIPVRDAHGRYYTVAPKATHPQSNGDTVVCKRGESDVERVRRG